MSKFMWDGSGHWFWNRQSWREYLRQIFYMAEDSPGVVGFGAAGIAAVIGTLSLRGARRILRRENR